MATTLPTDPLPAGATDQADDDLAPIEAALRACLDDGAGRPPRLVEAMRYAVLGPGKRLRPRLALMAARACGGRAEQAMGAAVAVELIHAYSLVHDDLPAMDDDDLRRGRPTCHRQFDEATAILVGDALQALAFEQVATHTTPAAIAARCCAELAVAVGPGGLVGGQVDDLAGAKGVETTSQTPLELLQRIHARKTGALITVALRIGAMTAGADEEQLESLRNYGEALGLLFQVTDDLLDAQGDPQQVGKRTGKDHEHGKLTYPGLLGVEASRSFAVELADRARNALDDFDDAAEPLRVLTVQVLERDH